MSGPIPVTTLLAINRGKLARLARRTLSQSRDVDSLRTRLGYPDAAHVSDVSRHGATATVTLDSAAWATRVRMRQAEVLAALRAAEPGVELHALRFKVRALDGAGATAAVSGPPRPPLSPASREVLRAAADAMTDTRLRDRLLALSRSK